MTIERLESLKAAMVGSFSVVFAFLLTSFLNYLVLVKYFPTLNTEEINFVNLHFWLSGLIAGFSGFLFGVTYRYIIRLDNNPHLQAGGVLAFGLVRGLTQIECTWNLNSSILPVLVLAMESIFWFALGAMALQTAVQLAWIKPFSSI